MKNSYLQERLPANTSDRVEIHIELYYEHVLA